MHMLLHVNKALPLLFDRSSTHKTQQYKHPACCCNKIIQSKQHTCEEEDMPWFNILMAYKTAKYCSHPSLDAYIIIEIGKMLLQISSIVAFPYAMFGPTAQGEHPCSWLARKRIYIRNIHLTQQCKTSIISRIYVRFSAASHQEMTQYLKSGSKTTIRKTDHLPHQKNNN